MYESDKFDPDRFRLSKEEIEEIEERIRQNSPGVLADPNCLYCLGIGWRFHMASDPEVGECVCHSFCECTSLEVLDESAE